MSLQPPHAFFFPTRVIIVDDDLPYIKIILNLLNHDKATFKLSADSLKVSNYLLTQYQRRQFLQDAVTRPETGLNQARVDIDIQKIPKIVYNPNRFIEITALVTDFNMPKQNGQQLCEKIIELPIKKLMMTSEADEKLAVNLLNQSVINRFIKKAKSAHSEMSFVEELEAMIVDLQESYFAEESHELINALVSVNDYNSACIKKPEFIELFHRIVREKSICEYYLIDITGSYLMLNASGVQSYLLLQSQDDMRTAIELIECSENPNLALLEAIKKGEKILYWDLSEDFPSTPEEQLNHSYSAQKVGNYYYSYVTKNILNLDQSKILSYREFLKHDSSVMF